ncbi:MAG TPA: hypothetical protein VI386_36905 [Candidatus Sulfotelmatobacter sp.]
MDRSIFWFAPCFLLPIVLVFMGCGGGSHQLQGVQITPAIADARNSPNGQVNFTATGTFNRPPSPVTLTSADVVWCVGSGTGTCAGNIVAGATVDQNGVAQCQAGFNGTVTILAGQGKVTMPDTGEQLKIFASARLTCP